jgi:hypothetical protein
MLQMETREIPALYGFLCTAVAAHGAYQCWNVIVFFFKPFAYP